MKALTNNTLIAISKHSNKVLKLATYLAQSEQSMLLDNIYMIDETTSPKDALEAFQKDFDKTVDLVEKSHQLLSTVRGDHIVEQLDNSVKDLRTIFEDKYDQAKFSIKLPSVTLNLKRDVEKDQIRNDIIQNVLDINYKEFRDFIKNCDKIYKFDEYTIETEEDAVEYLASIAYREKYDNILNKIRDIAGEFSEYRNTLGLDNRNLIDNEITFTRSMIDSIVKNSTYITKDNVEQLASFHKKNMGDVKKLYEFIKDNNYISSIELDADTNLNAVLDILLKTKDLKLNIPNQFCLKCRKLGNYNANGMYLPRQHIAAVDISNPSALIHELTHTADISNPDLYNHVLREELVNKVKKRIDINDLEVKHKLSYYLSSDEIIARLGEIAYILNKNNYTGQEPMSTFIQRVSENEKEYNSEFLNIAKPISEYLRRENVYFNFSSMKPEDLLEIKEYFKAYFGVNNDDIKPVYSKHIEYEEKVTKKSKKRVNEFKDSPFVKLDPVSVEKALDYNLKHNIIPFDDLFASIAEHIHMIARHKKTMDNDIFAKQSATTKGIYNWVEKTGNPDIQVSLIKNMYTFGRTPSAYNFASISIMVTLAKSEDEIEKAKSAYNTLNNCRYLNDFGMMEFRSLHSKSLQSLMKNLTFEDIYTRLDKNDLLTYSMLFNETFKNVYNDTPGRVDKFESYIPQIISDYKNHDMYKAIDYILKDKDSQYVKDFILQDLQLQNLSEKAYRGMVPTKPYAVENEDGKTVQLIMSSHYGSYYLSANLRAAFGNLGLAMNDKVANLDLSGFKPLLGINKQSDENYREKRKAIIAEYLKELQIKQEAEQALKAAQQTEHPTVMDTLKKKIDEDTVNSNTVVNSTVEKSENKPINPDSKSQMKLF